MSDVDPDLPDYLIDAILSQGPPTEDIDLVKNAFTWRTIEAELMELTYDSVLDTAGVRDASARRTMEFTTGDLSIVIEISGTTVETRWSEGEPDAVSLVSPEQSLSATIAAGSARFDDVSPGTWRIELQLGERRLTSLAFVVA